LNLLISNRRNCNAHTTVLAADLRDSRGVIDGQRWKASTFDRDLDSAGLATLQADGRRRCRVRAAFCAAARRAWGPFVRTARWAARRRSALERRRAAVFACRERAWRDAVRRGSRFSARVAARARRREGFVRREAARVADAALRFVDALALRGGGGSLTPDRRAFDNPMAIACFVDRAPCLPSRT
jgi:hypothetical protein